MELRALAKARRRDEGLHYNESVRGLMLVPENLDSSNEERLGVFIPPGYDLRVHAPPQTNEQVAEQVGGGASTPNEEVW